jgi:hypothetical protein
VGDLLAGEQGTHHVDALTQARVALGLRRPPAAGNVLVRRLPAPERDPQAIREHLGQRGRGLGDDGRVVTLARRVDHAERQPRRGHRGGKERPREARLALPFAPRREVVG